METSVNVIVSGWFGDHWLSRLFSSAIGPSPAPYRMRARMIEAREDGSALIEAYARTGESRWNFHLDDKSVCKNYPCNHERANKFCPVYYYEKRTAIVPAGQWAIGGDGGLVNFDNITANGLLVKYGYVPVEA